MAKNNAIFLLAHLTILAMLGWAMPLWGQCPTCKWADWGDRFEGVSSRQRAGGCCELLGVQYVRGDKNKVAAGQPNLHLFFWLPESTTPDIVVLHTSTSYMMIPKRKKYSQGLQRFSWPRQAVIEPLKINIDTLYTLIKDSRDTYFPALLTTSEKPEAAGRYVFILESGDGIDAQCTIEREEKGKLMPVRSFPFKEKFGGIFNVHWNGLNNQGQRVPGGTYALRLKGRLEGETIDDKGRLDYVVYFQHYEKF